MHQLPDAFPGPLRIVMTDGLIRRKIVGEQMPLAARLYDIENAIKDAAACVPGRSSTRLGRGHKLFDLLPLFVIEVGCVMSFGHVHPKLALQFL